MGAPFEEAIGARIRGPQTRTAGLPMIRDPVHGWIRETMERECGCWYIRVLYKDGTWIENRERICAKHRPVERP